MTATATAAAKAPNAAAQKQPAWMAYATIAELDSYIKTAKIARARADEMRNRWRAAHPAAASDAMEEAKANVNSLVANDPLVQASRAQVLKPADAKTARYVVMGDAAPATALRTVFIDPQKVDVQEDWNARVDFGDLEELKNSIKAQKKLDGHGLLNDIRVKEKPDGRYALIDGERRLISVMGLIDEGEVFDFGIPAKVEPADATDKDLIIKMFVANFGKPFLPYEEAQYYARLKASGMTIAQIEAATGRSDNSIVGALALLEADDDLVDAVVKGGIGATLGKSIAVNVRGNKVRQKELTQKALAAKKSGDKKAMKSVKKEIDEERRAKAAKKMPGKSLKTRMMDEHDISSLGGEAAERLKELLEKVGMSGEVDAIAEWVSNDRELQLAATFGAIIALRNVMGDKTAPKAVF